MIERLKVLSKISLVLVILLLSRNMLLSATFTVTNINDTGPGSFRDAISNANLNIGNDTIDFNIMPGGLVTIFPQTQLPPLTDPSGVFIDGLTQPGGATCGASPPSTTILLVEINGTNTGPAHGIWITSDNNVIQGLIINLFDNDGVRIEGGISEPSANMNRVHCCFIGTDPTGTADWGNGKSLSGLWAGVSIRNVANGWAMENMVDGNLISGNYAEGVNIVGPIQPGDVGFNHVLFNYIGTDISGTVDLGNDHEGVCLSEGAHDNDVADNLISGNDYDGVGLQGYSNEQFPAPPIYTRNNIIIHNIIGLDINLNPLGNTMHGIAIGEYGPTQWGYADQNTIEINTIAFNGADGIAVWEHPLDNMNADQNKLTLNNIYNNFGLGIDLWNNNVTPNDPTDPDTGPNQELNFPVIMSASYNGTNTTVSGMIDIDSAPTQATVEIFQVLSPDPSGFGEGDIPVGSAIPDAAGNWSFVTTSLVTGDMISATTTDVLNNTSEFSALFTVTGGALTGACCYADGSCADMTQANCLQSGGTYMGDLTTCQGDNNGNNVDDACEGLFPDSCEYYKSPYADYVPNGMPDFDQKQSNWTSPLTGSYSHCGPVALANCFWWFDSKFETNTIPPPADVDNYPLVTAFGGPPWDDHDANNVIPFVDSLALYSNTNPAGQSGTFVFDLANGAQAWINKVGLTTDYTVSVFAVDGLGFDFDSIKTEVLESQDVILLLGFWEEITPDICERIGGHYVTVAGTCPDLIDSSLCISDPFMDKNEGEPPAGSAHASGVHNDAALVSGPHGTIHHDKYNVMPVVCQPIQAPPFQVELVNFPYGPAEAGVFFGQNSFDPAIIPVAPQGGMIHTIIEFAIVICPTIDTCANQMPGDADNNGTIDISDIVYLTNFIYSGGPAPNPLANGDPNGDCEINIGDLIYLANIPTGGPPPVNCTCVNPDTGQTACCFNFRGNIDYDVTDGIDIADLVYFVAYSFGGGPVPPCIDEADVNASGGVLPLDIADIVYLVDYMFNSGPAPLICP